MLQVPVPGEACGFPGALLLEQSQLTALVPKEQSTGVREETSCSCELQSKMRISVLEEWRISKLALICISLVFPPLNVLILSTLCFATILEINSQHVMFLFQNNRVVHIKYF